MNHTTTIRNKNMKTLLVLAMAFFAFGAEAKVGLTKLRVENMDQPAVIATSQPHFSWQIVSDKNNVRQTAYQIVVADAQGEVWNSGKVISDRQLWVEYQGTPLSGAADYTWKAKVWTTAGESAWTDATPFAIGLLSEAKWRGYWIGLERMMPGEQRTIHTRMAARYLRKEFELKNKTVRRATAYVAGIGLHEFYVNGQRMGDGVLNPIPSDYRKTIYYNTYDVTSQTTAGKRICLAIVLGNGRLFPMQQHKPYKIPVFGFPKCRINVKVEYADGTTQLLQTDDKGWKVTAEGPIRANNEYDGEEYDARKELTGWASVGFDDSQWMKAERTDIPTGVLRPQGKGMKVNGTVDIRQLNGRIVDVGQNMAGWLKVRVRGHQGDTIRIIYAERLNADGTLYRDNFRNAQSTDIYVCNGKEGKNGRWWTPTLVYHGFRYVEIQGLKNLTLADCKAETVGDEMAVLGHFECSDTILNKVMHNAFWGIASNYKGMPVDCPQRDERQPWLGDRTMGSLGESFLFDNEYLYAKWMRDICEAQRSDGCIPDVAPAFWNYYSDNVTWPAALPFTCDMLWRQFGNRQPIDDSYPTIRKWVLHMIEEYCQNGIITKDKYGDWCPPPEKLDLIHAQDPNRITDGKLIATAYMIRVLQLLEQWNCEPERWNPIRKTMTEAFNRNFLTVRKGTSLRPGHVLFPDSTYYGNNTVTANILPLALGIVPDSCKSDIVRQVVENICVKNKGHVSCGVIGISWLLRTLSDNGFADVAYLLATQKSYPSWGYMANNGATTIWELWNGNTANPRMNSGNHVMLLGDLLPWCYQYIGGIRTNDAFRHFTLRPSFDIQDCEWANVDYESPYGRISSHWKKTLQHLDWEVEVPCNTTAEVYLPDGTVKTVGSGHYQFRVEIPTAHAAIMKDEFLYEHTHFPEAHAGTIVETKKGDLITAYFGGTHERDPDVCIYVNIKRKGENHWSTPILAADGVFQIGTPQAALAGLSGINAETTSAEAGPVKTLSDQRGALTYDYLTKKTLVTLPKGLKRKACWNPVLFEMPDGELWLFFKIGSPGGDGTGWLTKSKDGGRTWSDKEPLPKGFLGPIKNKPELIDGRLICGSSTEGKGWRFHVEIYDIATKTWKYVGPIEAANEPATIDLAADTKDLAHPIYHEGKSALPIYSIQPSILRLSDGRLQVLMRTRNGRLATSFSNDHGDSWSKVVLTDVPNNQSGTDAVTLRDGRHALIYNDFETLPDTKKGPRTPLSLALSTDGSHWQKVLTLEDSPIDQYSYPAIIQGKDGTLHCLYTWRRQRMAYKQINLKKLKQDK